MLTDSISENFQEAKTKVEWDKQIEKGSKIAANPYMLNIVKDINNMHRILSGVLPQSSVEVIFRETFRDLTKKFNEFYT